MPPGKRLPRRSLLRGAGGVALALPWLEAMHPRVARAAAPGKRFVVFYNSGGTFRSRWKPSGTETSFKLGELLAPLERHRASLTVVDGLDMKSARKGPGDDHMKGMGSCATGASLLSGGVGGSGGGAAGLAAGPSIDQKIAGRIGGETRFRSLELGVQALARNYGPGGGGTPWDYVTYADAGKALPPVDDPMAVFARLFKDGAPATTGTADLARLLADRRSVLDTVKDSYGTLAAASGALDRQRLEDHLERIREVEKRLLAPVEPSGACRTPALETVDHKRNDQYPRVAKLQTQLLVLALTCDLTRVATLQYSRSGSNVAFTWLNAGAHHGHQHANDAAHARICVWYAERFGELLDGLAGVREADGTLLDSTLVFWTNELADGAAHSHEGMPFVLAGSAGGAIRPGRFLSYDHLPANALFVSMMNAYGITGDTFGDPAFRGALPRLL